MKALPTATLWEAKPSPCAPPARIRLSRLQISPCLPREGRGEVLLLWLHIISAHHSWLPYRSPPKIRQECFVSAWVKETARLLEILKKKKIKLCFLAFSGSMGPPCPQDACKGMSITLEPHISACKPRKKIIADASIKLKTRDPPLRGEGCRCTEQSGEGRRQTAPVHPGRIAASPSLKQGSTCSESPGKIRARVAHQPAVANRRAELEYKVVHTFFLLLLL